jgi:AAA+ ATPase superfamily predicted ATPase
MIKPQTPFPATGYFGPSYFCDREEELSQLIKNLKGGNSTTLIALRRLGKTALIRHLIHHLKSKYITIYLDILATESLCDLLNQFSSSIATQYSERSATGKRLWQMIRSLRPVISYDALSGAPLISIKASPDESKKSIAELFSILEEQSKPVVIAIDEFQQILEYPEKQTDAWLRSLVQQLKNVSFIFSGSQQHLMTDLFANPSRPFFRSTQFMKIGKLNKETYLKFIIAKFRAHSKSISAETASQILEWTDCHTYYVQLLCNRIFLSSDKIVSTENWKEEASKILKEQEFVFFGYREMLTKPQWDLLKSIASEGKVYQPTSSEFISNYGLGNPATVLRSLNSLLKMELIYKESGQDGKSYYGIYDVLFGRWVR